MADGISINISIIAAMDRNGAIGLGGHLPWRHIQADMKHFRDKTHGKAVIMGRKTYESLPDGPLEDRVNIVVSRHWAPGWRDTATVQRAPSLAVLQEFRVPDRMVDVLYGRIYVAGSVREAILAAMRFNENPEIMVIGGAAIYREALPLANKMYITRVPGGHRADTVFPAMPEHLPEWRVSSAEEFTAHPGLVFETWEREEGA